METEPAWLIYLIIRLSLGLVEGAQADLRDLGWGTTGSNGTIRLSPWGRVLCFRSLFGLCPFPEVEMSTKPRGSFALGIWNP